MIGVVAFFFFFLSKTNLCGEKQIGHFRDNMFIICISLSYKDKTILL